MASVADDIRTDLQLQSQTRDFEAFVEARRDAAVRLAYRLLGGDAATAEDVAQNAFLRAHRALPRFRGDAALSTWFHRILVGEVRRHQRWQALRRLWYSDAEVAETADPTPQSDPVLRRRIAEAMQRLTAAQREAFVLVHLEGFTIEQAAAILGKATGTVKSHMHRALESLRNQLGDVAAARSE